MLNVTANPSPGFPQATSTPASASVVTISSHEVMIARLRPQGRHSGKPIIAALATPSQTSAHTTRVTLALSMTAHITSPDMSMRHMCAAAKVAMTP